MFVAAGAGERCFLNQDPVLKHQDVCNISELTLKINLQKRGRQLGTCSTRQLTFISKQ